MKCMFRMFVVFLTVMCLVETNSYACSRVTYVSKTGEVVTGRTMDWPLPDKVQLKVIKKGVEYKSISKTNPIKWTSKYGIVGVLSTVTGQHFFNSAVNEKGLAADFLWLAESNYGTALPEEQTISVGEQLEYILGNFATVDEVVNFLNNSKIRVEISDGEKIVGDDMIKFIKDANLKLELTEADKSAGFKLALHYIVTDKAGNNAVIEYVDGKVQVYEQKGKMVLTNDPSFDKMISIKNYFEELGIKGNMPGSSLSQSRFIYLTGWLNDITEEKEELLFANRTMSEQAVFSVLSLMRGVSTPLGIVLDMSAPNNTSTLWRTVTDITNNKFYFDSATKFETIWIDLNKVDFTKNQYFDLDANSNICGDVTKKLVKVKETTKTKKAK